MLDRDQSSSVRRMVLRAVLLLVPLLALAAALPWILGQLRPGDRGAARRDGQATAEELAASRKADAELADAEETSWKGAKTIPPAEAAADASGERIRWFQGFGVSVESKPAGATVLVNGEERGETPITSSVECTPGDPIVVEVRKRGLRPARRSTRCRQDQLVELSFDLK